MENKKQPNSVSVNSALHTRGLSENSQNLGKLIPVSSEDCPSSWDDIYNPYNFYDCLYDFDCLSDFETSSCACSIMDFDHE